MGTNVPSHRFLLQKALIPSIAVLALGLWPVSDSRAADNNNANGNDDNSASALQEVVVTGSLIPQTQVSLATPVITITNEDITTKGFADVAEALQRSSFATGQVQNGQFAGFTQAAKVVSFYGLDVAYTKYLIDGRPIADYPALYNGSESFASLNGIPTVLIDHIDTLPGAQSSIYGSDAIAGVVNIVMKKSMDGPVADARYGWTADGGGVDRRYALGDGFKIGDVNVVIGGQYEKTTPIWGFQRPLTNQYYTEGTTPQTAERDYLVVGLYGQPNGDLYYFEDPANCANVIGQFQNSAGLQTRPGRGQYCGTYKSGFFTINNGDESTQGYLNATYDITDKLQVFVQTLVNHEQTKFNNGYGGFYPEDELSSPYAYYEDPNLDAINIANGGAPDYYNVQRIFSPEEAGGRDAQDDKNTNNSFRATLGVQGDIYQSWKFTVDFTYSQNKLTENTHAQTTAGLYSYFGTIFGPLLGTGPLGDNEYTPNYAALYKPVTPAQYAAFSADFVSYSQTEESYARAQITNTDLFTLPGGSAGLALQVDGGDQGWFYNPDPGFLDGEAYLYTATAGSGHRSRYAGTGELQLPVLPMLGADLSGRYDDYRVSGQNVDKFTYNIGLQFKPIEQFILRGRYGTAFKAPTLADEFQGTSGYYTAVTDYYACNKQGYSGTTIGNCPYFNESIFGTQAGNPALRPITAKVWDLGFIATPIKRLTVTADFIHFSIENEINAESADKLSQTDAACLEGILSITSTTCTQAISQITRDPISGLITSVFTPKQNVAEENLGVVQLGANYKFDAGIVGGFEADLQYTNIMSHNFQQFAGDPIYNVLDDPFYASDLTNQQFKTKANLSLTWTLDPVSATFYVERYGETANYIALNNPTQYATPGAGNVDAWVVANASASYRVIKDLELTFAVNNLFNIGPPADHSYPGTVSGPYDEFAYNVYGRTYYITASYHAGSK